MLRSGGNIAWVYPNHIVAALLLCFKNFQRLVGIAGGDDAVGDLALYHLRGSHIADIGEGDPIAERTHSVRAACASIGAGERGVVKPLNVIEAHFAQVNGITATVTLDLNGQRKVVTSVGNGRLDAVANAIQSATGMEFHLENYSEHSLDEGSTSRAASYVGLTWGDGTVTWGAGTDTDIIVAGVKALVSAINNK